MHFHALGQNRRVVTAFQQADDAAFRVDTFDPDDYTLEVLGEGRIIRISRHASPAVQARLSQGGRFVLTVYAALVDGVWRIVR